MDDRFGKITDEEAQEKAAAWDEAKQHYVKLRRLEARVRWYAQAGSSVAKSILKEMGMDDEKEES